MGEREEGSGKRKREKSEKEVSFLFLFSFCLFFLEKIEEGNNHHAQGERKGLGCLLEGEVARAEAASRRRTRRVLPRRGDEEEVTKRDIGDLLFCFFFSSFSTSVLQERVIFLAPREKKRAPLFASLRSNGRPKKEKFRPGCEQQGSRANPTSTSENCVKSLVEFFSIQKFSIN